MPDKIIGMINMFILVGYCHSYSYSGDEYSGYHKVSEAFLTRGGPIDDDMLGSIFQLLSVRFPHVMHFKWNNSVLHPLLAISSHLVN